MLLHSPDNTANVTVKFGQFNRELLKTHLLPIIISDNEKPPQTSTNTLTIRVCQCDKEGSFTLCEESAKLVGVGIQVLVTIFICIFTILGKSTFASLCFSLSTSNGRAGERKLN